MEDILRGITRGVGGDDDDDSDDVVDEVDGVLVLVANTGLGASSRAEIELRRLWRVKYSCRATAFTHVSACNCE